jgi:HlyD family secretion protein
MPHVWLQDKDGKLSMMMLRTGVSDTSYTEIVRSELKEGDVVLAGVQAAAGTAANRPQQGMPGMMFMGGPPGGGRR